MSLSQTLAPHLSFLRRYARALAGSQRSGDAYVVARLEALVAAPDELRLDLGPRVALYKAFHALWSSTRVNGLDQQSSAFGPERKALERLEHLTPPQRQALLLTTVEGFTSEEAADILGVDSDEVDVLVQQAVDEIDRQTSTTVLIIEDEPIIAVNLEEIVESLGHRVAGVADTRDEAVAMAKEMRPGLVLADIQLADGSSGIDAVNDILARFEVPVIFITAFPDRLLTGQRPEPTFLITKPFQTDTVRAAISQALFFESTASAGVAAARA